MMVPFDYFVILADMRTGSNFLEANLEEFTDIHCHGELFNPHFIGNPKRTEKFGLSLQQRQADPMAFLDAIKAGKNGIHGFRLFSDHDPRALDACLADRRCAKIVLSRNPVDSYVSREIARKTGQWRLGDMKNAVTAQITFDPKAFEEHLSRRQAFQSKILRALQTTGQTGFFVSYEDLSDMAVINGIARFLGVEEARRKPATKTKKQNPGPLEEKVLNFSQMQKALACADYFGLDRIPNFEPRRGPRIPSYVAAPSAPVLYMPICSGPDRAIRNWLADLDGASEQAVIDGFTQKSLRQWKRRAKEHLTFTVVRHPAERLHDVFVRHILLDGPDQFTEIREILRTAYGLPLPEHAGSAEYDISAHRRAFLAFVKFVRGNLGGQTDIHIDRAWASQTSLLQGMGQFMFPMFIFRESTLQSDLGYMAARLGRDAPQFKPSAVRSPYSLNDIYDDEIESAVKAAYQRDYMMFGFGAWSP